MDTGGGCTAGERGTAGEQVKDGLLATVARKGETRWSCREIETETPKKRMDRDGERWESSDVQGQDR